MRQIDNIAQDKFKTFFTCIELSSFSIQVDTPRRILVGLYGKILRKVLRKADPILKWKKIIHILIQI